MFRQLFMIILGALLTAEFLFAASDKIEIKAKHIDSTESVVTATDNVVVYYDDSVIKASSAHYYKEKKLLVLDGHIELIGYKGSKEHSDHMEINTDTKEVNFNELFLVSENDVWIFSDKVKRLEENYTFGTSMLSSCDIKDPLWKMVFSHSLYNINEEYMKIYNAKVYLWDFPIFYTPYLAFSTNKERASGLLFPGLGYTEAEGFLYE